MDTTYGNWRQTDPRYNRTQAWTAQQFPEATYHYFRDCGCLVCALAMMLRHHNIEKTTDEELFDPWILNQRLIDCGAFYPTANLELTHISRLYPLEYLGAMPYSKDALAQVMQDDLPCLVTVPGINATWHFTMPYELLEDDVMLLDPLCGTRRLSSYDHAHDIRVFCPRNVAQEGNGRSKSPTDQSEGAGFQCPNATVECFEAVLERRHGHRREW